MAQGHSWKEESYEQSTLDMKWHLVGVSFTKKINLNKYVKLEKEARIMSLYWMLHFIIEVH